MNDDGAPRPLARFDFRSGAEGGSHLMLYGAYLVHRSESQLETVPLARVSAISVSFARDRRRLGWGVALVVGALGLLAVTVPLGGLAQGTAYRFLELAAAVLPMAALACALAGAALAAFGWQGSTSFTLTLAGGERTYVSRGRDTQLLDFAEMTSERLMAGAK